MKVTVTPGKMRVSSIVQVIDQDDVKIFSIDLASKYPHTCAYLLSGEGKIGIIVLSGPHSLHLNQEAELETVIEFGQEGIDFSDGNWEIVAEGGRYTIRVAIFRWSPGEGDDSHYVWTAEEDGNDGPPSSRPCGNRREPDGQMCTGVLTFEPADFQAQCPVCRAWIGRYAPQDSQ